MKKTLYLLLSVLAAPIMAAPAPTVLKTLEHVAERLQDDEDEAATAREFREHLQAWKEGREPLSAYPYIAEVMRLTFGVPAELLRELIAAGADVNAPDSEGNTPLHHVVSAPEQVQMLIAAGADVNAKNRGGATPFLLVEGRFDAQVEVRRILAAAGAQVDEPPVVKAGMLGDAAALEAAIAAGADVNAQGYYGRTALHWLSLNNNAALCTKLLEAGANPNIRDERGWPPLHLAAIFNNDKACAALLSGGAERDATDEKTATALHYAALTNRVSVIRALLDGGCSPNARDERGFTPLHVCVNPYADCTVTKMLIAAGADVNACGTKDKASGVTPLHRAAENGNADICSVLLMNGADPTLRRADGATPLELARREGHELVVLLLEDRDELPDDDTDAE